MSIQAMFFSHSRKTSGGGPKRKKASTHLALNPPQEHFDFGGFQNEIPLPDLNHDSCAIGAPEERPSTSRVSLYTTGTPQNGRKASFSAHASSVELNKDNTSRNNRPYEDFVKMQASHGRLHNLIWPAFAICVPMVLLSAALLYIVFTYQVKQVPNAFNPRNPMQQSYDIRYIWVDFSATKLVFLASFLSTLAPLLAGCIMTLAGMLVYESLKKASDVSHFQNLPTPYQMSLLIGILAASYEQLLGTLSYLISRKRAVKVSPVLIYALAIFLLSVGLGIAVTITDAFLHIATQTVDIINYSELESPAHELGRGLNAYCLGMDRVGYNSGYPCSYAAYTDIAADPDFQRGQPEMERIAHNTSSEATMQLATLADVNGGRIAYLLPQTASIPSDVNYKATTFGVATNCSLMPPKSCNLTRWGENGRYTSFNCSSQFYGVLGMVPPEGEISGGKAISKYTSFLAINQNANLIYNYFADQDLEVVYNTADLEANATQSDDAIPWPDDKLQNTIFMGFAWRSAAISFTGTGPDAMNGSDKVQSYDNTTYLDYFLNCEVSSYNVSYTWVNGSLNSLEAVKQDNGSILNIWTGNADYTPKVSGSDWNLQDYNVQSAIAGNTTSSYEQRFGELISQDALANIGAFTSGRQVLQQQKQTRMLVAKVPKSALGALLACSLLYPIFGIALLIKAAVASKKTGPVTPLFSYWGLASAAFLENASKGGHEELSTREDGREDAFRLFIRNDDEQGHRFGLWKRSQSGYVTEIQRSQTHIASWL